MTNALMGGLSAIPLKQGGYVVKRTPGHLHGTFESAATEAVRLTWQEGGRGFMVLQVVGIVAGPTEAQSNG